MGSCQVTLHSCCVQEVNCETGRRLRLIVTRLLIILCNIVTSSTFLWLSRVFQFLWPIQSLVFRVIIIICHTFVNTSVTILATYSGVVILFVRLYFVSLLSAVIHLFIPLYPFLLQIFWSCQV